MKNIIKKHIKPLFIGLFIGTTLTTAVQAASWATGPNGYYSAYNVDYYSYNTIYTGKYSNSNPAEYYASGDTIVMRDGNSAIPSGYAGIYPRVFDQYNILQVQGTWSYSPNGVYGFGTSTTYSTTSRTNAYYSEGLTRAYNGSGYWTYSSFQSPNLNDFT